MKTQELDLFTKIKNRFSEQEALSFIEYFEKTITEKTEEAIKHKMGAFVDRKEMSEYVKEMSEFVVEMKVAINKLDNKITNLETNLDNKITNLETNLDNKITNLEHKLDSKITNLVHELKSEVKTATIKNLWLVITAGIFQVIAFLIAIYLNNHNH